MDDVSLVSSAYDIIGDVHGCIDELLALLTDLGYTTSGGRTWQPPPGRTLVFVGDLADRGPANLAALTTAMDLVDAGLARWAPGNHDVQLQRLLEGEDVPLLYGLDVTVDELDRADQATRDRVLAALQALPSHHVLDDGALVVAHTGLPESLHGQESPAVRHLAAYGYAIGDADPPADWSARHAWVKDYQGRAAVVYGHTPRSEAVWVGQTIDIDTGCVYGGALTALRWPEREIVQVRAARAYAGAGRRPVPRPVA